MIPHLIHQTWKSEIIPAEFQEFVASWRSFHPSWEFRLWSDEDNRHLVQQHYDWLLPTYDGYPFAVQRADMARILYMHQFGGLYVDLDFECLRPFDDLVSAGVVFMGREKGGLGWYKRRLDYACNALLASPPGHSLWIRLLKKFVASARPQRRWESRTSYVLATTGPQILDDAVDEYLERHDDLIVYPQNHFYPASAMEKNRETRRGLAKKHCSHAVHHFANSWFSSSMHLVMWLGYFLRRPLA